MQTTTVLLVRHGEVENPTHVLYERLPDFHLSERGHRMAQASADYIAATAHMSGASAIVSSPLERTVETATHILTTLNSLDTRRANPLQLQTDERIIEAGNEFRGRRIGHGDAAPWRPKNWRLYAHPGRPSWGETYQEIGARMSDFLGDVVDEHAGETVIAVSHESPIWTLRSLLVTGKPEHNVFKRKTALASITSLTVEVGTHRLVALAYADPAATVE